MLQLLSYPERVKKSTCSPTIFAGCLVPACQVLAAVATDQAGHLQRSGEQWNLVKEQHQWNNPNRIWYPIALIGSLIVRSLFLWASLELGPCPQANTLRSWSTIVPFNYTMDAHMQNYLYRKIVWCSYFLNSKTRHFSSGMSAAICR